MGRKSHHHQKISFLNCIIPTTNRVVPRKHFETNHYSPSPCVYSLHDPSSPRIGCVGQIKRNKSLPCRIQDQIKPIIDPVIANSNSVKVRDDEDVFELNRPLPLPLPLPKDVGAVKACSVSLWKRRCGALGIEALQIGQNEKC